VGFPAVTQSDISITALSTIHSPIGSNTDNRAIDKGRVIELVINGNPPNTYAERLALGYCKTFTAIRNDELAKDDVLMAAKKLHKLLFSEVPGKQAIWRTADGPIYRNAREYPFKHQPIPARDVPEAFERICDECQKILSDKNVRVLYIISAFTVDTIHVQPFEKEGQLLIRLLLLHMLHNAKFPIFEYTCFEHLIHENIVRLYSSVEKCMLHWEQEINDYRLAFDFWVDLLQKSCSLL